MAIPLRETVAITGVNYTASRSNDASGGESTANPGLVLTNTTTGLIIAIRKVLVDSDDFWVLPCKANVQPGATAPAPSWSERINAAEDSSVLPPSISICILQSDACGQLQTHPKYSLWMTLSEFTEVLSSVLANPTAKKNWCYVPGCSVYPRGHRMAITCIVGTPNTLTVSPTLTPRHDLFNPLGWNMLWEKYSREIRQDMAYTEPMRSEPALITGETLNSAWYKYMDRLSTKFSLHTPFFIFYVVLVLRKRKVTLTPGLVVDRHDILFWLFRSIFLTHTYQQLFRGLHHLSTLLLAMLPYEADPTACCVQRLVSQLSVLVDSAVNFPYYSIDYAIIETLLKSVLVILESPCQMDLTAHIPEASRIVLKQKRKRNQPPTSAIPSTFYQKHVRLLHRDIPSKQISLLLNRQWKTLTQLSYTQLKSCRIPTATSPITSVPLWSVMWTYGGCQLFAVPRVINNQPAHAELSETLNSTSAMVALRTPVLQQSEAVKRLLLACQLSWHAICPVLDYTEEKQCSVAPNTEVECNIYNLLPALVGPIDIWQQCTVANKPVHWFCTLPTPGENDCESLPHRALPRVNLEYQTVNGVCIEDIENQHVNGSLQGARIVKAILKSRGWPLKSTDFHRLLKNLPWYKKAQHWKLKYTDSKYWLVGTDKQGQTTARSWKHASEMKTTYPCLSATPSCMLQHMKTSLGVFPVSTGRLLGSDLIECWRHESSKPSSHFGIRQQAAINVAVLMGCLSTAECFAVIRLVQNMPMSLKLGDSYEANDSRLWSVQGEKWCTRVRLFRFFVYVSWQYSGILQPYTNLKQLGDFKIVKGNYPAFWWLCDCLNKIAVETINLVAQPESAHGQASYHSPLVPTTASTWPVLIHDCEQKDDRVLTHQQQKQLGYLIKRQEHSQLTSRDGSCALTVCLPVGSGKTLVMLKFMEHLMCKGTMPDVVLMAITPESLASIHEEIRKVGFEDCHILPLSGDSFQCTVIAGCPQIRGSAAQLRRFRICLIFHDHLIKFVKEYSSELHTISKQLFFVFDEVDKISHSSAIRRYACVDLLTSWSRISLFMSGTPLQKKMDGMIKLLPHTCEQPVTKQNVVSLMTADIQSMWATPVESNPQPNSLVDNWYWKRKMSMVSLTAREMETYPQQPCNIQTVKAHAVSVSVTNTLVTTALSYVQGSTRERVLLVAADAAHRDLLFAKLYARMQKMSKYNPGPNQQNTVEQALIKVSRTNSVSITPGSKVGNTVDIVVVAASDNRGYHLTTLSVLVTSVYNTTPQDQRQMEGRLSRLGQQRHTLTKVTVLTELQKEFVQSKHDAGSYVPGLAAAAEMLQP